MEPQFQRVRLRIVLIIVFKRVRLSVAKVKIYFLVKIHLHAGISLTDNGSSEGCIEKICDHV